MNTRTISFNICCARPEAPVPPEGLSVSFFYRDARPDWGPGGRNNLVGRHTLGNRAGAEAASSHKHFARPNICDRLCSVLEPVALDPEPMQVLADPIQIERVLTNLCRNADDAMNTGGSIRVVVGTPGVRSQSGACRTRKTSGSGTRTGTPSSSG